MPSSADRRVVVVNATPIIALTIIDQLSLFRDLYGRVLIPPAVRREVLAGGPGRPGAAQLEAASWIEDIQLRDPRRADLISDLDRGEAEVIALAQEVNADLVVIDERLGRRHARRLGLPVTGTLGVLLKAKSEGRISRIAPMLEALQDGGIRLANDLVERVMNLAGEAHGG